LLKIVGPGYSISVCCTRSVGFSLVNIRRLSLFLSEPKFTIFFSLNVGWILVYIFSDFDILVHLGDIHDRSLKLPEIPPSCVLENFFRVLPPNLYPNFHPCPAAHHMDKFGAVIPTGPEVIGLNRSTLNFTPIYELLLPQIVFGRSPNFWS